MAANVVTKHRAYYGDQAGAFVDQVTLDYPGDTLIIENRSATVNISFTYATGSSTPATPTSKGDNTFWVPANTFRAFSGPFIPNTTVYLVGDATAMSYVVELI